MKKLLSALIMGSALLGTHFFAFSADPVSHHQVVSDKDKLFFYFNSDGKASVPPGSPPQYVRAYIMTPDKRKIRGPKIDVTNPVSQFQITVHPPILFGSYTVVVENLSAPNAMKSYVNSNVVVRNSRNTRESTILVKRALLTPFNPGDSLQGSFFPFRTTTKNELTSKGGAPIIKKHASLHFTFTPKFDPTAQGKWRFVVTTPDNKVFKSRKIRVQHKPHQPITFKVDHPIRLGMYTIAAENIDATNFLPPVENLIDGLVKVTNSVNSKAIDVAIPTITTNNPGTIQEGYFTPCYPFIGH